MLQRIIRVAYPGNQETATGRDRDSQSEHDYHELFHDIIECLISALEAKDPYTCGHSSRVADMSVDLAQAVGLKREDFDSIHIAAHLHDIGKIGVSENVLSKPGKLDAHEWEQIQSHPVTGYDILRKSRSLYKIAKIVLHHHERWDGKGYPTGLQGNTIPLGSRIIGVADAIDAMTTSRPYRGAMTWKDCYYEVQANKGKQFDPMVAEAAEKLWDKWAG
jgi:putative nucleotidyltransferase with HDIG domain